MVVFFLQSGLHYVSRSVNRVRMRDCFVGGLMHESLCPELRIRAFDVQHAMHLITVDYHLPLVEV